MGPLVGAPTHGCAEAGPESRTVVIDGRGHPRCSPSYVRCLSVEFSRGFMGVVRTIY